MVRRSLSWPVLIGTILALAATAGGLALAHSWQLSKTAASMLSHAGAAENSDPLKAAEYLQRYLRLAPDDHRVQVQLAEVYSKGAANWRQKQAAIDLCYRALSTSPDLEKEARLRQTLAEMLLETGRFVEAEKEAQRLLATNAESPSGNRLLALAVYGQLEGGALVAANYEELKLIGKIEKARHLNPSDVSLAVALASLYRERVPLVRGELPKLTEPERHQRADNCLDKLVRDNPDEHTVYLARFQYRRRYGLDDSQHDLDEALKLAPQDSGVLRTAAHDALTRAMQSQGQLQEAAKREAYQEAKAYFEKVLSLEAKKSSPDVYLGLGEALLGLGDAEAALANWREGLKQTEQPTVQIAIQGRIADLLLNTNRLADAKEPLAMIDRLLGGLGASTRREDRLALVRMQDLRRATWHLRRGEPLEAVPKLRQVILTQAQPETSFEAATRAWLLLAEAYAALKEWHQSAIAFDQASVLQPKAAFAYLESSKCWLLAGRADLASDRAEQALDLAPTVPAWFLLATAQFRYQLAQHPQDREWARFEAALTTLERAPTASSLPAPWRVDFLRADFQLIRARETQDRDRGTQEAAAVLGAAREKYAASPEFLGQLCLVYQQLEMPEAADEAVSQLRGISINKLDATIAETRLAVIRKKYDRAAKLLAAAGNNLAPQDAIRIQTEKFNIALAKRDLNAAKTILLKDLADNPRDVSLIRRLAELDMERGDLAALASWEKLLDSLGDVGEPLVHYYRASRLLLSADPQQQSGLKAALAEHAKLASLRPGWAETHTLRGMIQQRLGNPEQAIASYEQAVQLGETRVTVFEQLIALLEGQRRNADAEKYLSKLESEMPFSQRLTELGSVQKLRHNDPEQALEVARKGIERRPNDPLAHLWLGRLLLVRNQTEQAEQSFERAVELAPQDVRTWNGLFSFYVRTGAKDKARETLSKLGQSAKLEQADRSFVLGQGFEFLGDWNEAARHYQETVASLPDHIAVQLRVAAFYLRIDPSRAESCLKRALELDPKSGLARRMLAALWASRGTAEDFEQAQKLLAGSSDDASIPIEDRRLNALLLVQQGGQDKIEQAIQLFEIIVRHGGGLPGDRIVLAQLYESQARAALDKAVIAAKLDAAKRHLVSVTARPNPDFGHLAAMIDFLLRHEQRDEAVLWLDQYEKSLSKLTKANPDAIAQLVLLRIRHGSLDPSWLDTLEKEDRHPLRSLALRARALAAAGNLNEVPALVEPKAKELLEQSTEDAEKAKIQRGLGDLYYAVKDFPRAEQWYRRLIQIQPARFDLLVAIVARQGRLSEAIQLCETAAKTDDSARPATVLASTLVENLGKPADMERADSLVSAALLRFPGDAQLLYSAAVMRLVQGRYEEAIESFRAIVELNPRHVAAMNNLALLVAERPNGRAEALQLIDRALAISGSHAGLLDTKGTILAYHGEWDEALKWLLPAAESLSNDPRFNFHLALAYKETGDIDKARQELGKALERQLESQILTQTDRRLLVDLLTILPKK